MDQSFSARELHPLASGWCRDLVPLLVANFRLMRLRPISRLLTLRSPAMKAILVAVVAGYCVARLTTPDPDHSVQATASSPMLPIAPGLVVSSADPKLAFAQYEVNPPIEVDVPDVAVRTDAVRDGVTVRRISALSPARPDIAGDVERGVSHMNAALKTMPVAVARMSDAVQQHGVVAALAYGDPEVTKQTDLLSAQLATSLQGFAAAIGKDMERSIRESGIQRQSVPH